MKMIKWLMLVILSCVLTLLWVFVSLMPFRVYPKDGVWYCKEHQIQISFEYSEDKTYVTIDGEQVECILSLERGSDWLFLHRRGEDGAYIGRDSEVLAVDFISLRNDKLVVRDEAGTEYVFVRRA